MSSFSLTPEQRQKLIKQLVGPAAATTDGTSMTARSIDDIIKAIEYALSQESGGVKTAFKRLGFTRLNVPYRG